MEEKEFMAEYDISKLVDRPPAGYARVDAFFTAKDDVLYASLPRWPADPMWLEGIPVASGAKITLLASGDELRWQPEGSRLRIEAPESLRSKIPYSDVYVLKIAGVGSSMPRIG
jgi:alpha-L-fucosidase